MEFMLDTVNLAEIKKYAEIIPLSGVTSNPSIIKKEGKIVFFDHMKKIREIIGEDCSLHIQVVGQTAVEMIEEAQIILNNIDSAVFIKVPVSEEGLKAIKGLKQKGIRVTATAIYTKFQAYMAIAAGAEYIAPYFNRMENLSINPKEAIEQMAKEINRTNSQTKILAASFKNVGQVNAALEANAQAATMSTAIIKEAFAMPSIQKAVDDFAADWKSTFGTETII